MLKHQIKSPTAVLQPERDRITVKYLDAYQFANLFYDVQSHVEGALKRFANAEQETCYYFMRDLLHSIRKNIVSKKPYYNLNLSIPQARYFVKHFSRHAVTDSTIEVYSIIDQKLPILTHA